MTIDTIRLRSPQILYYSNIVLLYKDADVLLRSSLTSSDALVFLETSMTRRFNNHTDLLQADGGPEFKDQFRANVHRLTKRFRIARPYKKNEQSYIESFNRTLRKECLGWSKYKAREIPVLTREVVEYLVYYHETRPHILLNMLIPQAFTQALSHI